MTQTILVFIVSLFYVLALNIRFFSNVLSVYPLNWTNLPFLLSIAALLFFLISFLFNLLRLRLLIKIQLILLFLISSIVAYYMDTFRAVIDDTMLVNVFSTNVGEAKDLITWRFVFYVLFLGVLPSYLVYRIKLKYHSLKKEVILRIGAIFVSLALSFLLLFVFSKNYASFFREHKPLRYSANPAYYLYSVGLTVKKKFFTKKFEFVKIASDAKIIAKHEERKLMVFVVGEAARADRFSLNNYAKETNPLLKQQNVISFPNVYSCGTATAVSVPCMFSIYNRSEFDIDKAKNTENILDVLKSTQEVHILWRDNNSSSKNVADRVLFEDFMGPQNNPVCDPECRDEGMLVNLQKMVDGTDKKNILIVLHQMGNHGPAYYQRYPASFKKFLPTCETNQLEKCTQEEISNTYDNVILYTDYFLAKTIDFLKANSQKFNTMLFYVSDHGESLGEGGLYLHSIPYSIAPKEQKNVATIFWFGGPWSKTYTQEFLSERKNKEYSHDYIFHSLLGLFEVKTSLYRQELDIFYK